MHFYLCLNECYMILCALGSLLEHCLGMPAFSILYAAVYIVYYVVLRYKLNKKITNWEEKQIKQEKFGGKMSATN